MSDADWDAEDYEPPKAGGSSKIDDRWEGEDEDDDVKDSWDKESDEDDNSKGSEDSVKAVQRKKKKKLQDIIAEKEAAKMKELEDQARLKAEEDAANTPEGKLAKKLKQKEQDEKESLALAMDMMGVDCSGSGIDAMVPNSKDDFDKLQKAISEKVQSLSGSSYYNDFVENLIKDLSLDQPATTLKKLKIHIETLHSTKLKEEKAAKGKGGKAGKSRGTVKMDLSKDILGGSGPGGYDDDFDDFMWMQNYYFLSVIFLCLSRNASKHQHKIIIWTFVLKVKSLSMEKQ